MRIPIINPKRLSQRLILNPVVGEISASPAAAKIKRSNKPIGEFT
jgi:hypothetical protein